MTATPAGADRLPWRLSSFYFFYYATVGAFMPYWSPYLAARGFSPAAMGIAYALMGVMRAVVILQCSMPVAVYNYLFALRWRNEPEEVAGAVVLSTVIAVVTIPLLLGWLTAHP